MRLVPAVIFAKTEDEANKYACAQSIVTHASPDCIKYAGELGYNLWRMMNGNFNSKTKDAHKKTLNVLFPTRDEVKSSGYVGDTFNAAWWSFVNTDSFKDAVLLAVNLGDDADTVGAVAGQIAGAYYGYDSIPQEWLDILAWHNKIEEMFNNLIKAK